MHHFDAMYTIIPFLSLYLIYHQTERVLSKGNNKTDLKMFIPVLQKKKTVNNFKMCINMDW